MLPESNTLSAGEEQSETNIQFLDVSDSKVGAGYSIIDGKKFESDDQAFRNMQIQVGGIYWFM
jgi:hypothetical protein